MIVGIFFVFWGVYVIIGSYNNLPDAESYFLRGTIGLVGGSLLIVVVGRSLYNQHQINKIMGKDFDKW